MVLSVEGGNASKTSLEKVFHTCPAGMRPRTRERESLGVLPEKNVMHP